MATRAAAVPEVVRNGLLAAPDDPEALAEAIFTFYRSPDLRASCAAAGLRDVEQFEKRRVAAQFLSELAKVAPGVMHSELPAESTGRRFLSNS